MTSSSSTLGALLSSQADMDDVLRAATEARPRKRRGFARTERRLRKSTAVGQPVQSQAQAQAQTEAEQLAHQ